MAAPISSAQITRFPLGVSSFGMPVIGGGRILTTGNVFFVDSTAPGKGDDTAHGRAPFTPFATINFAVNQCQNDSGDVILVLPSHIETLSTAAAINCNVRGVSIVGVSYNGGRDRPVLTFASSVAASIDINAANFTIENIVLDLTGITNLISGINVKAADFSLRDCELITANASGQALIAVSVDGNSHRARFSNNYFNGSGDQGSSYHIFFTGSPIHAELVGNRFVGFPSSSLVGGACDSVFLYRNIFQCIVGCPAIAITVTGTGIVAYNVMSIDSASAGITAALGVGYFENYAYYNNVTTMQQILVPIPSGGAVLGSDRTLIDEIIGAQFSYNRANYIAVTADFSSATWNTVATHEILVVTGAVRLKIIPEITLSLTSGGSATLSLGEATAGTSIIGATAVAALTGAKFWLSATPAGAFATTSVVDRVVDSLDIGFAVATAAMLTGTITFHCWWEGINSTGAVVAGVGGVL